MSSRRHPSNELVAPWDTPASSEFAGCLALLILLASIAGGVGAVVSFAEHLWGSREPRSIGSEALFFSIWLVIVAVTILLAKAFVNLNRIHYLSRLESKSLESPIYLLPATEWRRFDERAAIRFSESGMHIWGSLHPYLLPPFLVLLGFQALMFFQAFRGQPYFILGTLGFLLVLAIYSWLFKEDRSIVLRRQDLASVKCLGPVVLLRFARPPVAGLKAMRIFVSRPFRRSFFADFDRTFAGLLPEPYRTALAATTDTASGDQAITYGVIKPSDALE